MYKRGMLSDQVGGHDGDDDPPSSHGNGSDGNQHTDSQSVDHVVSDVDSTGAATAAESVTANSNDDDASSTAAELLPCALITASTSAGNSATAHDSDSDDDEPDEEDSVYPPPPPPPTRSASERLLTALALAVSRSIGADGAEAVSELASAPESATETETDGDEEGGEAIETTMSKCGAVMVTTDRTLSNLTARTEGMAGSTGSVCANDDDEEDSLDKSGQSSGGRALLGRLCCCCKNGQKKKKKFHIVVTIVAFVSVLLILVGIVGAAVSKRKNRPSNAPAAAATAGGNATAGGGGGSQVGGSGSGSGSGSSIFSGNLTEVDSSNTKPATTPPPTPILPTYLPGDLTVSKEGVLLSTGLDVRIIATSLERVRLADGTLSVEKFHNRPDAAATFVIPPEHSELYEKYPGGYVYTSNAESSWDGGVGSIFFDRDHNVVDYKKVLSGATEWNCGGGKTPWQTWISCEEPMGYNRTGFIYEVDPFGRDITPRRTVLGQKGGAFESFAYDVRDKSKPRFFYTEDHRLGPVRRFTPRNPNWDDPSSMLHGEGDIEYLVLEEITWGSKKGTFSWTKNKEIGEASAAYHFPYTEGIDCTDGLLVFANKARKALFELDLDLGTWSMSFTTGGAFDGGPDTVARLLHDPGDILYMTEDGGEDAGVHGRDSDGNFYVVLESPLYDEETTGLAFSPDGHRMYVAYQKNGVVLAVWREDGLPFSGRTVDIKYHSSANGGII